MTSLDDSDLVNALGAEAASETAIELAGARLVADPDGALWWAEKRLLAVADLHLEKGSAYAVRTGQMLPPYDSRATLGRQLSTSRSTSRQEEGD